MRNIKRIILMMSIIMTFAGCKKDPTTNPVASFTTDKSEYAKGDTIHLTNTSSNASTYLWTMPDGTTLSTVNADFIFTGSQGYQPLSFTLEAFSKDGSKNNSVSLSVTVTAVPNNTFSIGNYIYSNIYGDPWQVGSNYWNLMAATVNGGLNDGIVNIYFPGLEKSAISGLYTLQSDYNTLTTGKACILMKKVCYDCLPQGSQDHSYFPIAGQVMMTINYTDTGHVNSKVHVVFNEIDAKIDSTNTIIKISCNIKNYY